MLLKAPTFDDQYIKTLCEKYLPADDRNGDYIKVKLPRKECVQFSSTSYQFYPFINNVVIVKRETNNLFEAIIFRKNGQPAWEGSPYIFSTNKNTLTIYDQSNTQVSQTAYYKIDPLFYNNIGLLFQNRNEFVCINRSGEKFFFNQNTTIVKIISYNNETFVLQKGENELFELIKLSDPANPIINNIRKFNQNTYLVKKILWCINDSNYNSFKLIGFDLFNNQFIKGADQVFNSFSEINIESIDFENHFIRFHDFQFDYLTGKRIEGVPGEFIAISKSASKIITRRADKFYLNFFNEESENYNLDEVKFEKDFYTESYLSPNGKFLIAQKQLGEYHFYDIEKEKITKYFSEKFIAFTDNGNLIFEQDKTRKAIIIDHITFQNITPDKYQYYKFLSPDGKLFAQVSTGEKYYDKLNKKKVTREEYNNLFQLLNRVVLDTDNRVVPYKEIYYKNNRDYFKENNIDNLSYVHPDNIIEKLKFTAIGIVGKAINQIIDFPNDLVFYNYSAFSYDNRFYAYVGKPSSRGLIHIFKIHFDEALEKLEITDSYLSRLPKNAAWVCGFSKNGYFATYDSNPDTYLIKMDNLLFSTKPTENELNKNLNSIPQTIYQQYNSWTKITGKNFLCFSPTGNFIALSEKSYEPLTLGGLGHKESSALHVAETQSGKIKLSFLEHGDSIKTDERKKVVFVAFSEDEKKLMSLSNDGVVIIRNINFT